MSEVIQQKKAPKRAKPNNNHKSLNSCSFPIIKIEYKNNNVQYNSTMDLLNHIEIQSINNIFNKKQINTTIDVIINLLTNQRFKVSIDGISNNFIWLRTEIVQPSFLNSLFNNSNIIKQSNIFTLIETICGRKLYINKFTNERILKSCISETYEKVDNDLKQEFDLEQYQYQLIRHIIDTEMLSKLILWKQFEFEGGESFYYSSTYSDTIIQSNKPTDSLRVKKGGVIISDIYTLTPTIVAAIAIQQKRSLPKDKGPTLIVASHFVDWHIALKKYGIHFIMYYGKHRETLIENINNNTSVIILTSYGTLASDYGKKTELNSIHYKRIIADGHDIINTKNSINELLNISGTNKWLLFRDSYPSKEKHYGNLFKYLGLPSKLVDKIIKCDIEEANYFWVSVLRGLIFRQNRNQKLNEKPIIAFEPIEYQNVSINMLQNEKMFYKFCMKIYKNIWEFHQHCGQAGRHCKTLAGYVVPFLKVLSGQEVPYILIKTVFDKIETQVGKLMENSNEYEENECALCCETLISSLHMTVSCQTKTCGSCLRLWYETENKQECPLCTTQQCANLTKQLLLTNIDALTTINSETGIFFPSKMSTFERLYNNNKRDGKKWIIFTRYNETYKQIQKTLRLPFAVYSKSDKLDKNLREMANYGTFIDILLVNNIIDDFASNIDCLVLWDCPYNENEIERNLLRCQRKGKALKIYQLFYPIETKLFAIAQYKKSTGRGVHKLHLIVNDINQILQ